MKLASNSLKYGLQIVIPLSLGGIIFWWMYKDLDFSSAWEEMKSGMTWSWMLLSLVFGILSHVIRGIRWKLTLAPLQEYPKTVNCIHAIFLSYAANLIIPRVGEVSRCGVLRKYDGTSFSKSLGTVVTERLIDMVFVLLLTGLSILLGAKTFSSFFDETGTNLSSWKELLTSYSFWIVALCTVGVCVLLYFILRRLSFLGRVKDAVKNVWEGILSLKRVRHFYLFILYTVGIWLCYFLQFYVAMFCFPFTADLGVIAALLMFVVGSIAVVVPTPNGAGPWHFAIITMLTLFGVNREDAGIFALITHGIQTFLLILLGIYAMVVLPFSNNNKK